jgi:hypothetical protein
MGMPVNTPRAWRFGVFELDAPSGELRRNGTLVKLREQPARILLLLLRPRYFGWDDGEEEYYDYGEILVDEHYIDWKYPCALYPPQRDARLSAQRGYFTIHGNDMRPLNKMASKLVKAIDLAPLYSRPSDVS